MKSLLFIRFFAILLVIIGFCSCEADSDKTGGRVATERIEYPVFIKDPYGIDDGEWWIENIESSKRQALVQILFDWAYNGRVKCYHAETRKPLTAEQVKMIGNESDTITFQRPDPPYDEFDTVISRQLDLNDIHKLKFMEEWQIDESGYTLRKNILGVAPLMAVYADSNQVRGYKSLFWILFDDRFAAKEP